MIDGAARTRIRAASLTLGLATLSSVLFSCGIIPNIQGESSLPVSAVAETDITGASDEGPQSPDPPGRRPDSAVRPPSSGSLSKLIMKPAPGSLAEPPAARAAPDLQTASLTVSKSPVNAAKAFASQCGDCHWAYRPRFLPARSWQALLTNLPHHFGEDASVDADSANAIAGYLVANAADANPRNARFLRGLGAGSTPTRITDMPFWRSLHGRFSAAFFARHGAKTKASCTACHGPAGPS